jgi:hypothetical protein
MALNWKGGWISALGVSDMTYYKDDVVDHNNVMYIVTATSVPIGSPAPGLDMSKWDTVVSGAIGTSGSSGTSGTSGSSPIGTAKVYTSGTAGTSWTFTHNLGTLNPIVQVWGTNGKVVIPQEIVSVDTNTIKIEFPELVAGKATIGNGYSGTSGTSGTRGTSGSSGTSGFGVATGGTSGQILAKVNNTSGNTQWVDNGAQATYLSVGKNVTAQNVSALARLTNWDTPITSINAGEWNGTTGIFTATKAGVYRVTCQFQLAGIAQTAGNGIGAYIYKNSSVVATGNAVLQVSVAPATLVPPPANVSVIISVAIGDTISVWAASQIAGNTASTGNSLIIEELPSRVIR